MIKEYKKEFNVVYINCHKATTELGFKIFKEDIISGIIKFKVPMSILSFGEKFSVLITQKNPSTTIVEVTSEETIGIQIIDWGKNDKNMTKFFETLTKLLNK